MKIIEARPQRATVLECLKKTDSPVIIYGAGVNGKNVCRFLETNGVEVLAFVISNGQAVLQKAIDDYPVLCRSELNLYNDYALLLSTGDYPFEKEILSVGLDSFPGCLGIYRLALGDVAEMDYAYFNSRRNSFEQTYNWLEDDLSRQIMEAYLNARIGGDFTRLLDLVRQDGYDFSILHRLAREIYVDCGAYEGDAIDLFLKNELRPEEHMIYAFEPDSIKSGMLASKYSGLPHFNLISKAVFSKFGKQKFKIEGLGSSHLNDDGEITVETITIDEVLNENVATIIKMDIEGAELDALRGAQTQLFKMKPRLAICVYHKPEDLITIPQYIKSVNPDYKFLLRHQNKKWISELVLYAI